MRRSVALAIALGSSLQRAAAFGDAVWEDVAGSETVTNLTVSSADATRYFRLVKR